MVETIKLSELTNRKRKNAQDESDSEIDISSTDSEKGNGSGGEDQEEQDDDDEEIINVDFDFFNGNPDVDFHAIKNLTRQLLGLHESNKIQLSTLADTILQSPMTTIKTDGQESDPYCFVSFIDYQDNKDHDFVKYLKKRDSRIQMFLNNLNGKKCAVVVSERLINMPAEVVPPLYKITLDDIAQSMCGGADGNGTTNGTNYYDFYLIVSRKYEVNFDIDEEDTVNGGDVERSKKRVKNEEVDFFHEEDRFLEKYAKIKFDLPAFKGVIPSFLVLDHAGLVKGIQDLETEISSW